MELPGRGRDELCSELTEERGFLADDPEKLQRSRILNGRSVQGKSPSKWRWILAGTSVLAGAALAVSAAAGPLRGLKQMMAMGRQGDVLDEYLSVGSRGNHSAGRIRWAVKSQYDEGLCLEVRQPAGGQFQVGDPIQASECYDSNHNQMFIYPFGYGQIRFVGDFRLCLAPPRENFDYFHLAECNTTVAYTEWNMPDDGMGAIRWAEHQGGVVLTEHKQKCMTIDAAVLKKTYGFEDSLMLYSFKDEPSDDTKKSSGGPKELTYKLITLADCDKETDQASAEQTNADKLVAADKIFVIHGNVRAYEMEKQPAKLHQHYGYLSEFWLTEKKEMSYRIRQLWENFGIREFQFYLAFEGFSSPPKSYKKTDHWMCKIQDRPVNPDMVKHSIAFIKNLTNETQGSSSRTWLYLHAQAVDYKDTRMLSGFKQIDQKNVTKRIAKKLFEIYNEQQRGNNEVSETTETYAKLCGCRIPESMMKTGDDAFDSVEAPMSMVHINDAWAIRIVKQWAEFAKYLGFDGIHWDTEGDLGLPQDHDDHTDIAGFLRTAVPYLQAHNLTQTLNFVDGYGWDRSLLMSTASAGRQIAFKYWEGWNPKQEDWFWQNVNRDQSFGAGFVWACYPGWSEQHCCMFNEQQNMKYHKDQIVEEEGSASWAKAYPINLGIFRLSEAEKHGGSYVFFGDGLRHLQGPFLPDAQFIAESDIQKIKARRWWE